MRRRLAASSTPAPAIRIAARDAIGDQLHPARQRRARARRAQRPDRVAGGGDEREGRREQPELRLPALAVGQELRQERRLEDQRLRIGERDREAAREGALGRERRGDRRLARLPQGLDAEEQQIGRADEADRVEIAREQVDDPGQPGRHHGELDHQPDIDAGDRRQPGARAMRQAGADDQRDVRPRRRDQQRGGDDEDEIELDRHDPPAVKSDAPTRSIRMIIDYTSQNA